MSVYSFLLHAFISIDLVIGDGLYNFIKLLTSTIVGFVSMIQQIQKAWFPFQTMAAPCPLQKL
jgi:hypothetical protein